MRRKMGSKGHVALFWLSAALLVGCAALPTEPERMLQPGDAVSADAMVRAAAPDGRLIGGLGGVVGNLTKVIAKTIDGTIGGNVETGRFAIEVPGGAFNGSGEITVTVPDSNVLKVELHIVGVPNDFHEPVRLVVSYDGALGEFNPDPSALQMVWFNETTRQWVVIPSTVDRQNMTIWTELEHFSEYGVIEAKAGW